MALDERGDSIKKKGVTGHFLFDLKRLFPIV